MKILPEARTKNIVVQDLKSEVLIYDLTADKAFCLNTTSGIIFNACGNRASFEDLRRRHKFTDDLIFLALDELRNENLLEEYAAYESPFAGISRRDAIKKVGLASMIALPLIVGITAPTAADAASQAAVACGSVGTQCVCTTNSNNNPSNTCGSGAALFGFAACPAGCACFSSGICQSNPGCVGTCQ